METERTFIDQTKYLLICMCINNIQVFTRMRAQTSAATPVLHHMARKVYCFLKAQQFPFRLIWDARGHDKLRTWKWKFSILFPVHNEYVPSFREEFPLNGKEILLTLNDTANALLL